MKIRISDQDKDDFIRNVVSMTMTRDDDKSLTWKLPKRLVQRPGMADIVIEEMAAELKDLWG